MSLEDLERDLSERLAFGRYETGYLHRATRETSLEFLHGRAALLEDSLGEHAFVGAPKMEALCVLPDAIAARVSGASDVGGAIAFRRHRWVRREDDFIASDTVVTDRRALWGLHFDALVAEESDRRFALPPMGELRAGEGQRAVSKHAHIAAPPPDAVRAVCDSLHHIWNGRRFDQIAALYDERLAWHGPGGRHGDCSTLQEWLKSLLTDLPDAVWMIDRWSAEGDRIGVLWRLHAHHVRRSFSLPPTGRRVRLIGSTMVRMAEGRVISDDTLFDEAALHIQLRQPEIAL